jgi:cytochrome c biogenesis protein CcmG, thiol:disulfide interchange protein DsbE
MTVRKQWMVILTAIAALGVGSYAFQRAFGSNVEQVGVGAKAPPFGARMVDGSGRVVHLADFKGHVVLLNVWATWCGPCKAEMPTLEQLYKMYGPQGLKIVAVSIDETASDDSVRNYARNMGLTFDILHDPQYEIEKTYQVMGYPESFVIDKDGIIRKTWLGAADWASQGNIALVRQLLGLPAAVASADSTELPAPDPRGALAPR